VEFTKVISWRRSVRRFKDQPIEKEKLLQILDAARVAPSSSNSQPWHFIVVDDKDKIGRIARAAPPGTRSIISFSQKAAAIIVACYRKKLTHEIARIFGHENHLIDVAIATDHLVLRATDLGIGTCWIGWFNEKELKRMLKIPSGFKIAALVALGYPAEESTNEGIGGIAPGARKGLSEITSYNTFGVPIS